KGLPRPDGPERGDGGSGDVGTSLSDFSNYPNYPGGAIVTVEETAAAEGALNYLNPDSREDWLLAAMALNKGYGPAGRPLWDSFSKRSKKFDQREQDATWRNLKPDGGIGLGSLFKRARDNGWRPQRVSAAHRKTTSTHREEMADRKTRRDAR